MTSNFPSGIKIKLNGKRLIPSKQIKYLGIYLDEHLSGVAHCAELMKKLNRAIGLLAKARHYVLLNDLINIYYATFSPLYVLWLPNMDPESHANNK